MVKVVSYGFTADMQEVARSASVYNIEKDITNTNPNAIHQIDFVYLVTTRRKESTFSSKLFSFWQGGKCEETDDKDRIETYYYNLVNNPQHFIINPTFAIWLVYNNHKNGLKNV
jgi:hypothetical protein